MTGEAVTTPAGLSEGILWDFKTDSMAEVLLAHYGIPAAYLPACCGGLSRCRAPYGPTPPSELGLSADIPLAYRSGDQPNNALSLNVLEAGRGGGNGGNVGGRLRRERHAAGGCGRAGSTPFCT